MTASSTSRITYDRYSLKVDGQPVCIRSGAMHYFRLPSQDLWRDRLSKLKAAGYNTVDLYFNWGFHSKAPGTYDFTGIRDISALLDITEELGLFVIARPGPYINAEVSGGGFPHWMLAQKDLPLRNRKDGAFEWSDTYMGYVKEWWEQIVPKLKDRPNILMMQIENEYSTHEVEPDYIQALYKLSRDLGMTVPLSHNDLFIAGLYEEIVDLYAFDNYSVTQFEVDWREINGVFSVLDNIENSLRPFCENRPLMAAELQAGWFGTWRGVCYTDIIESLGRDHIALTTKSLIAQGLTVFNHYKAIGGTNWDYIGSLETYSSYDFGAPISETGLINTRLYEAKAINSMLASFPWERTDAVSDASDWPFEIDEAYREWVYLVRKIVSTSDSENDPQVNSGYWLTLRNLTEHPKQLKIALKNSVDRELLLSIQSYEALMLPILMPLKSGWQIVASSLEPFYQDKTRLILKATNHVDVLLTLPESLSLEAKAKMLEACQLAQGSHQAVCLSVLASGQVHLHGPELAHDQTMIFTVGEFSIILMGQTALDHCWPDWENENAQILTGADAKLSSGKFLASLDEKEMISIDGAGKKTVQKLETLELPQLPALAPWEIIPLASELYSEESYQKVTTEQAHLDSLGLYEGALWYRYTFKSKPRKIAIEATHIWAVFCNGQLLQKGHYLNFINGLPHSEKVEITLPKKNTLKMGDQIVIYVDSLGHPKGFHDDEQTPQGLLELWVDDKSVITDVEYSTVSLIENTLIPESVNTTPLFKLDSTFLMPDYQGYQVPLTLDLGALNYERINIILNGVLVGRHWRACFCQSEFYLPPGILKTEAGAINHLSLLCFNTSPPMALPNSQSATARFPGSKAMIEEALSSVQLKAAGVHRVISLAG